MDRAYSPIRRPDQNNRLQNNPALFSTSKPNLSPRSNRRTSSWSAVNFKKNMWPRWTVNLSPRYGHVIVVSGYLVLTDVNLSWQGCPISKKYTVNQVFMSLSTYFLEYGRHVARLRRRAYAPKSNTASHDNHKENPSWVSFSFPWWL